jgi:hypothetical protein
MNASASSLTVRKKLNAYATSISALSICCWV